MATWSPTIRFGLVPLTLSTSIMGGRYTTVSRSAWVFLGAAAFALVTVLLSCARPGRIAGRVSPVEAVRYTENQRVGTGQRASRQVTPLRMAMANLGRGRKKTALVAVSLSLAVVLLNVLVTFLTGFDVDTYLAHRTCADFIVSTQDYFSYRGFTLTEEDIRPVQESTEQSLGGFAYGTGLVKMYLPEAVWHDEAESYLGEAQAEGLLYTLGSGLAAGLLSAAINPLAGRLLENAYWYYRYHYTIAPVVLLVPVFALLGYAIPAVMYRQAQKQSVVDRLREADA